MRNDLFLKQIGNKIRDIRKSQNITLRELGKMCNLDFGSLSRIENGQKNSYVLTLKNIADKLEVDIKEFL